MAIRAHGRMLVLAHGHDNARGCLLGRHVRLDLTEIESVFRGSATCGVEMNSSSPDGRRRRSPSRVPGTAEALMALLQVLRTGTLRGGQGHEERMPIWSASNAPWWSSHSDSPLESSGRPRTDGHPAPGQGRRRGPTRLPGCRPRGPTAPWVPSPKSRGARTSGEVAPPAACLAPVHGRVATRGPARASTAWDWLQALGPGVLRSRLAPANSHTLNPAQWPPDTFAPGRARWRRGRRRRRSTLARASSWQTHFRFKS